MILKFKNKYSNYCLISILFICVFQSERAFASREPIIRVLISKNNNLRIRSDRSIPLTIEGEFFSIKKIKGLTLKNEKNRKILYFDRNKQKKYNLKNNQQFQKTIQQNLIVELTGIEPATLALQTRCSPS